MLTFLQSTSEVMKSLAVPGDHPELDQQLLRVPSNRLRNGGTPAAEREFVRKTVQQSRGLRG